MAHFAGQLGATARWLQAQPGDWAQLSYLSPHGLPLGLRPSWREDGGRQRRVCISARQGVRRVAYPQFPRDLELAVTDLTWVISPSPTGVAGDRDVASLGPELGRGGGQTSMGVSDGRAVWRAGCARPRGTKGREGRLACAAGARGARDEGGVP